MRKSAMINECWIPQSNHRDTLFSIYLVERYFHRSGHIYTYYIHVRHGVDNSKDYMFQGNSNSNTSVPPRIFRVVVGL